MGPWPVRLLCPWDSPGKNTVVVCCFLLHLKLLYSSNRTSDKQEWRGVMIPEIIGWNFSKLKIDKSSKRPAATDAKSLQLCPTLCDPIDSSPPGSPIPGILQARTLEWVAISFSNAWKWKVKVKSLSLVQLLATPWTAAYQSPPSMGFSRQEYWSGLPLPSLKRPTEYWIKEW